MIELNKPDIEWIFSGIGASIITILVALYLHKKKQRIDVTLRKPKSSIKTNFKKIRILENTIKLDDHFFPLRSIRNLSIDKKDIRTESQKKGDDVGGKILIGLLLSIGWLLCVITALYAGIEYGLSGINIEGLLTDREQSLYFNRAIIFFTIISVIIVFLLLKWSLVGSSEMQIWEWTLKIVISDEIIFLIKSNTKKIEFLKDSIERRMQGDINEGDISFEIYKGGVHEKRLVTAFEDNFTDYSSRPVVTAGPVVKQRIGNWRINGDGTVADHANDLMWIQAPWGMDWSGSTFTGRVIEISWVEAKNLFGKGEFSGKSECGRLNLEELHKIRYEKGFVSGTCRIEFSGYDDWRLATADEWRSIQFMSDRFDYPNMEYDKRKEYIKKLFPYTKKYSNFWTATGKWHPYMCEEEDITDLSGASKLMAKLEIVLSKLHRTFNLKKFQNSGYTAWVCSFDNNNDVSGHIEYPVMFVRKLESEK